MPSLLTPSPSVPPPRNKALLRASWPLVSLSKAFLNRDIRGSRLTSHKRLEVRIFCSTPPYLQWGIFSPDFLQFFSDRSFWRTRFFHICFGLFVKKHSKLEGGTTYKKFVPKNLWIFRHDWLVAPSRHEKLPTKFQICPGNWNFKILKMLISMPVFDGFISSNRTLVSWGDSRHKHFFGGDQGS